MATRRKIEHQAARSVHEHLIVYTDSNEQRQIWQWVRREPGRSAAIREHTYHAGQSGEALIQKLDALAFSFEEETGLTIGDVARRARAAFDVDRVTKRFYDRFKAEHDLFLGFITGIRSQDDLEWYASVMLNRLMFIYFIQKKGFLDDDRDYLRKRLGQMQETRGPDQFLSFYRHFLLRLFHEGLGQQRRSSELDALIGDVPYLNGGLFDVHQLERANEDIEIPDNAFERLFDFFDSYQWHLDDRPLRADDEINPEVLGYIFEQYVNQKQMGAYYTKEDVTGFMAASALLPVYLDRLETAIGTSPWELAKADPRRYIPEALQHGWPGEVRDVAQGDTEDRSPEGEDGDTEAALRLPGESKLEFVDRRRWVEQLIEEMVSGSISDGNVAASRNLELATLALDFLADLETPTHVVSAYRLLKELAVLDPTCGSGAFLFASLHLLRDIYLVVIDKAEECVAAGRDTEKQELNGIVSELKSHPSREYFVLKTIVLSNLYGVDLMEEATEIARLRLFLALVAGLQTRAELEPLPDLDLNVRAGNLLVGVTTPTDAEHQFEGSLLASERLPKVVERAHGAAALYREFVDVQNDGGDGTRMDALKEELRIVGEELSEELDRLYVESVASDTDLDSWRKSHQPFHWFIEFPDVMQRGGFDVIIGNPPYIRKTRLDAYKYQGFETDDSPDIFAPCM
ncbi:MAG: SAM-dependent methyltransferase, partial [Actinomycetota bacterium]|nr:SAM-dependent methyltransferase [Actinomycetota bacterium]